MSFFFIIEQQFRAEKSLLSNRINNELLFINLAKVPAEGILFPHLLQAVNVSGKRRDDADKIDEHVLIKIERQMELKTIPLNVDKSKEIYGSANCQILLKTYEEYYQKIGYNLPWVGYFVIKENQIVGSCGFTGQPKEGKVEIAYWTFKEYEGQGISSFSCKKLLFISQQFNPTIIITAKTAPEHNASTKILQNNGFTFTEIVQDEEIGDAWLWTLKK